MSQEIRFGRFVLRWSPAKRRPVVRLADDCEDWDYEDEADAADMSAEIRLCPSLDEAALMLGLYE